MTYLVRFFDVATSQVREERLPLASEELVRERLSATGCKVLSVRRVGWRWQLHRSASKEARRSRQEVALICREARALISAGLSVVEALEALAGQATGGDARNVFADLLGRLRAGRSLSAAMADVGGFPKLLIASVQSSERTSNLAEALDAYLRYDEIVGTLHRKVVSAALYPSIVVSLGLLISVFLLWVVVPRFASLYGQMAGGASAATLALLRLSLTLKSNPAVLPVGAALVVAAIVALTGAGRWRAVLRKIVDALPALKHQDQHFERARFFEALALLVRGGYSLREALTLCEGVAGHRTAADRIAQARAGVERGQTASRSLSEADLTDSVTERLLRAGERGGDFAEVLQAISRRHSAAFETFVERATRIVEPVLLLGVAVLVGGMVVLLYMPIFDIAAAVR